MNRGRARAAALLLGGLLLVAIAVGAPGEGRGGPLDPAGTGPLGARGLVVLLEELDARVEVVRGAPPDDADTAVLLADLLVADDVEDTLDWVSRGGVLVVADDFSPLASGARDAPCPAALAGVDIVEVDRAGRDVRRDRSTPGSCFDGFVRRAEVGAGTVIVLGTPLPLTNELLDEADDPVLAAALLAPTPGTRVAFVDGPSVGAGDDTPLADLIDPRVRQALLQAALAVLVWVAWRSRRLGRPVLEEQPVTIAGSELVVAVGRLLDARRRPDEAAAALRAEVRRAVGTRLGLPADAGVRLVAGAVAGRGVLDEDRAAAALGERSVVTDDDLLAVAADLDRIRTDLLGSRST